MKLRKAHQDSEGGAGRALMVARAEGMRAGQCKQSREDGRQSRPSPRPLHHPRPYGIRGLRLRLTRIGRPWRSPLRSRMATKKDNLENALSENERVCQGTAMLNKRRQMTQKQAHHAGEFAKADVHMHN